MNGDLLLEWMSHLGSGTWSRFRQAVRILYDGGEDPELVARSWRSTLSELGHTDFDHVAGTWAMHQPLVYSRPSQNDRGVFLGARTRADWTVIAELASVCAAEVEIGTVDGVPHLELVGAETDLREISAAAGVPFVPCLARRMANLLQPVAAVVGAAAVVSIPRKWEARSFDPESRKWVDGCRAATVVEFKSSYGERTWLFERRKDEWVAVARDIGMYAAASLQKIELARYDGSSSQFQVSRYTPLPHAFARVAALCCGPSSEIPYGYRSYSNVPPDIAGVLLVALGIRHPGVGWFK